MHVSKSMPLVETPDYSIRLEYNDDYVIIHLPYVNKMTKGVFVDMKYRLEDWHDFFTTAGYSGIFAAVDPENNKIKKLIEKLGFRFKGSADNMQVYYYGEMQWDQ